MRGMVFSHSDVENNFERLITNGSAFQFSRDDISRIRKELRILIDALGEIYLEEAMQQESDGQPGVIIIKVRYIGFQSRKGVQRTVSSDKRIHSIEISPAMSTDDMKNTIFQHVKSPPPDLSRFDMKLIFGADDTHTIETKGKITVDELNLVRQRCYHVELVLKDQPRVRMSATEAKKIHEEMIQRKKLKMEE